MRPRAKSLVVAGALLIAGEARAQTCWVYVDGETARAPIACREQGDLTQSCSWNQDCFDDLDASDCCTSIPASSAQTVLAMHTNWHNCFGNVGASDGNNPPGRGQRWYAFHRQFEHDFNQWRADLGIDPIQSLHWCPGMNMPIGHFGGGLSLGDHPANCGIGPNRPNNRSCVCCQAFSQCLFRTGGGPVGCAAGAVPAPGACTGTTITTPTSCGTSGGITFPYTTLEQFPNVEQVANLLDDYFHGKMHSAVGFADGGGWVNDTTNPSCSPRDPMFWRLHKAIDDVVRAWQDAKPVDVVVVLDRSGSMSEPDSGGGTKFAAALAAIDMFADLLETCNSSPGSPSACDVQANRIGIVSYSNSATLDLPLTVADEHLRDAGSPLANALAALAGGAGIPGGCTGSGGAFQRALQELCGADGDCRNEPAPPAGVNPRKAILFLTDGLENVPPCLQPASTTPGATCGTVCNGAQITWENLEFTQLVAVGFGNAASLNADTLTLLAERQGGIYMQNPNGAGDDLKDFFAKALGRLTDEFLLVDPNGLLAANEAATPVVEYTACGDEKLTVSSGWQEDAAPGELRLLVRSPAGDLVRRGDPGVESSREPRWDFVRTHLPYRASGTGTWRAQLVRPHKSFLNGFATDAFDDPKAGVDLVRAEIQRLCPDGCRRVLYYEEGRRGPLSVYAEALKRERAAGLVGNVQTADRMSRLATLLRQRWDLVVYARMGDDVPDPLDPAVFDRLCGAPRILASDLRPRAGAPLMRCLGGLPDQNLNWRELLGNGQLFTGSRWFGNPGHPVATLGMQPLALAQADVVPGKSAGIVARGAEGKPHHWFVDVLGRTLSKLEPHARRYRWRTGDDLIAAARILPSYVPAGGWDEVDARVEVEYPLRGLGTLAAHERRDALTVGGETLDGRAALLNRVTVPTAKATFPLYDDGTHGDLHPGNAYWEGALTGLGGVDGEYKLRYLFDLTKNGCTTHRELLHSLYVDVGVDPKRSGVQVERRPTPNGGWTLAVTLRPADGFGNLLGPGRLGSTSCVSDAPCKVAARDLGGGDYGLTVEAQPGSPGVRLRAFGADFDLPLACPACARLVRLETVVRSVLEHGKAEVTVVLDRPAPPTGATIQLSSSNVSTVRVPASVVVKAGADRASFVVELRHAHEGSTPVVLAAVYGGDRRVLPLTVQPRPIEPTDPRAARPPAKYMDHRHKPGEG